MSADDLSGLDTRSPELRRLDFMVDQVGDLASSVRDLVERIPQGHIQEVHYKTQGMGAVGIVCAIVSFCCVLMMLGTGWLIAIEFGRQNAELHDLRAWRDIHQNHISAIEAREQKGK